MKLSSREKLLKEADEEIYKIKKQISKNILSKSKPEISLNIKSQQDWEKFVKDEELAEFFTKKWKERILDIANRGGELNIDLDALNPSDQFRAKYLLSAIEREVNMAKYGNVYGYGKIFKIMYLIFALLSILGIVFMEFSGKESSQNEKNKKNDLIQKLKNPPDPLKSPKNKTLDWVKSVISIIKK